MQAKVHTNNAWTCEHIQSTIHKYPDKPYHDYLKMHTSVRIMINMQINNNARLYHISHQKTYICLPSQPTTSNPNACHLIHIIHTTLPQWNTYSISHTYPTQIDQPQVKVHNKSYVHIHVYVFKPLTLRNCNGTSIAIIRAWLAYCQIKIVSLNTSHHIGNYKVKHYTVHRQCQLWCGIITSK